MANLQYADVTHEIASIREPVGNGAPGRNFVEEITDRYLFYDAKSNLPHCVINYVRTALDGGSLIGPLLDLTLYGKRYGWTVTRANELINTLRSTEHETEQHN